MTPSVRIQKLKNRCKDRRWVITVMMGKESTLEFTQVCKGIGINRFNEGQLPTTKYKNFI